MIEEIKKLRRKGLTFKKIAEELDTTVGKVQYQWRKYNHTQKEKPSEEPQPIVKIHQPELLRILQEANWNRKRLVPASFLSKWFTGGEQLFPYWTLVDVRRTPLYITKQLKQNAKVVRLYDVTYLPHGERSAHIVQESVLERGKEALAWRLFQPSRSYMLELGVKLSNKKFFPLVRSNVVRIKGIEEQ
ncbi:DUF4912 domain-containing protein [Bacillus benzoevorans]|uniref:Uncharacterized protein n=1 Tax=Bacillus benzoevorans TaxID=1456 RepID=A0A7X0LUX7_9BACI|nr:DUF4912 domain-containing protein [Bacillus benzoevorans]MBB6444925.1 hypothetical protein [Bacillus benzoevorans]